MRNSTEDDVFELEPFSDPLPEGPEARTPRSILDTPVVTTLTLTFSPNPLPTLILDGGFSMIWANEAAKEKFDLMQEKMGSSFFSLCRDTPGNADTVSIYRALRSRDSNYTWNGRITCRRAGKRTLISHAQIIPILGPSGNDGLPAVFTVFLNDITKEYNDMMQTTFLSLLEASILKDKDTGRHVQRVNRYSGFIARILSGDESVGGIDFDFVEDIGFLASMHDVGKIGTPDSILNKDGKLEPWEWEIMKEHTINGAFILGTYPNPMAREIALFHHERWNGGGYPYGLAGTMIPISARIVALCDAYDALRSRRCYKEPFSHKKALELIEEERGTHFDPQLAGLLLDHQAEFDAIYEQMKDV